MIYRNAIILIFFFLSFSCNDENINKKFVGDWEKITDNGTECRVRFNGKNFILEFIWPDKSHEVVPAFYNKKNDRLSFKYIPEYNSIDKIVNEIDKAELAIIFDMDNDQLVFEHLGVFKRKVK